MPVWRHRLAGQRPARRAAIAVGGDPRGGAAPDATRLAVLAVAELVDIMDMLDMLDIKWETTEGGAPSPEIKDSSWWDVRIRLTTADVTTRVNAAAREMGLTDDTTDFATSKKIGRLLTTLRIKAVRGSTRSRIREREVTRRDAYRLLCAYLPEAVRRGTAPRSPLRT